MGPQGPRLCEGDSAEPGSPQAGTKAQRPQGLRAACFQTQRETEGPLGPSHWREKPGECVPLDSQRTTTAVIGSRSRGQSAKWRPEAGASQGVHLLLGQLPPDPAPAGALHVRDLLCLSPHGHWGGADGGGRLRTLTPGREGPTRQK